MTGSSFPEGIKDFNISLGQKTWQSGLLTTLFCNPAYAICPERSIVLSDCFTDWAAGNPPANAPWLLMANDVRTHQVISPTLNKTALEEYSSTINVTEWSARVESTTAVLCTADYSIEDTKLRIDTARKNTSHFVQAEGPLSQTNHHLINYTGTSLAGDVYDLYENIVSQTFPGVSEDGWTMFDLISRLNMVNDNSDYLDPEVLMDASARAFKMLAAQMAGSTLRVDRKRNVTASTQYFVDRLHVKPLSFWIMAVGFASMSLLTLSTFVTRPRVTISQDPGSIAGCACILSSLADLQYRLSNLGSASDTGLRAALYQPGSRTVPDADGKSRYSMVAPSSEGEDDLKGNSDTLTTSHESWHPLAATLAFRVGSLIIIGSTILTLAILQHISDTKNGIADVKSSKFVTRSLSTYVPAAFTLLLATLCTSAAFAITTLSPYYDLSPWRCQGRTDRTPRYLRQVAQHCDVRESKKGLGCSSVYLACINTQWLLDHCCIRSLHHSLGTTTPIGGSQPG